MAAACEIPVAQFLQSASSHGEKLVLPRQYSPTQTTTNGSTRRSVALRISHRFPPVRSCSEGSSIADHKVLRFYRTPLPHLLPAPWKNIDVTGVDLLAFVQSEVSKHITDLKTERCFNVRVDGDDLSGKQLSLLELLLMKEEEEEENLRADSFLEDEMKKSSSASAAHVMIEVGPRRSWFTTDWSTNAVWVCSLNGLTEITGLEKSRRYLLYLDELLSDRQIDVFVGIVRDQMTERVCQKLFKATYGSSDYISLRNL